jgi:hypothetical protein
MAAPLQPLVAEPADVGVGLREDVEIVDRPGIAAVDEADERDTII